MIREMRFEDCAVVAKLWRELLNVPAATEESVRRTFTRMSGDDRYRTFVAEEDGIVVGFITLVEVLSFDDPDGYIKTNGIAVLPEYQHRGIGQQLVSRAEKEGLDRGASSIGCASNLKRTGAHLFWEKLGYEKSAFWFHKNFPARS